MPAEIITVMGPISAHELGITLPHEHLFANQTRITKLSDHLLNDISLITAEVRQFREAGGRTIVDLTNRNWGRDPLSAQRVARETGLNVIMGCGWYREPFYDREVYEKSVNELAEDIVRDITQGIDGTDVRAGIIGEIGCDGHYISPAEERSFRAAARAHNRTGLAISTHATSGYETPASPRLIPRAFRAISAYNTIYPVGLDQLDLLEEEGVDLRRVVVGHCDTFPDPEYHEAIAKRGAWVEFDVLKGRFEYEVEKRVRLVTEFIARGRVSQLLLSQDVCYKSHLHAYGGSGYDYLLTGFVPRLRQAGLSDEQVHSIIVENPRQCLSPA